MILIADRDGERADQAIARLSEHLTRSAVQRLLDSEKVFCAGRKLKKSDRLSAGDRIEIEMLPPQETDVLPEKIPLDIVYEDQDVIVINKPKGLVVHPAAGHWSGTLVNALLYHCKDSLSGINGALRPGIVHRIDMDTSGLLIVAKNDFAHQALALQLQDHSLSRTYECVVHGTMRQESGTIDAPIGRHAVDRKKMAVTERNSKSAVTHWRVLERFDRYTRLECALETGRTHQIRVHLSWKNHPILGDTVYGPKKTELGQSSQCLHARSLSFRHPRSNERIQLECPLPDYFLDVLCKLRKMGSSS